MAQELSNTLTEKAILAFKFASLSQTVKINDSNKNYQ